MKGKKYPVRLTETERQRLLELVKTGGHPARRLVRANILLRLDENGKAAKIPEQKVIAKQCACQTALVYRVSKQYGQEGIERVLNRKARQTPPVPGILNGEAAAKIIALCRGEPPEGHSRWTLRLLGARAVELGIVEHISAPTAGKLLKKDHISLV
jgi:hypothetical protein